jgi:Phosphotransferase enzyme family
MPLSEAGIVRYLIDHALVDKKDVVDGDFIAIPSSRQHRNVRIRSGDGPGLFVKQPGPHGPLGPAGIMREAGFYWLVSTTPPFDTLADIVPRYVLYDPGRATLVLEASTGDAPYRRQSLEQGFPPAIGTAVGKALTAVHRIERKAAGRGVDLVAEEPPWALAILQASAQGGLPQNPGTQFALGAIGRHIGFERQLSQLRESWRPERLIHGDMKWDNCLVESGEGSEPAVRIVDWEMAAWGDAAWDAGSLIQDYISQSLLASPLPPEAPSEAVAAAADQAMAAIRPAIAAFWSAYAPTQNPEFVRRSVAYAGARILQTCVEVLAVSSVVTPNVAALLQLSHEMLHHPDSAATSFLGFR